MKKKAIIGITIACVGAVVAGVLLFKVKGGSKADPSQTAYVQPVSELMSGGELDSMFNFFAGVVESQDEVKVNKDQSDVEVKVKVKVGDEVKKGDVLFSYNADQYQSKIEQGEIDLERLKTELESAKETIEELNKEKAKAVAKDQGSYTLQIQEEELEQKEKEYEIKSKKKELKALKKSVKDVDVKSEVDGIIKSENEGLKATIEELEKEIEMLKSGTAEEPSEETEQEEVIQQDSGEQLIPEGEPTVHRVRAKEVFASVTTMRPVKNVLTDFSSDEDEESDEEDDKSGSLNFLDKKDEEEDFSFTADELAKEKSDQEQRIKDLELDIRESNIKLKQCKAALTQNEVTAKVDGIVTIAGTGSDEYQPFVQVSGSDGCGPIRCVRFSRCWALLLVLLICVFK